MNYARETQDLLAWFDGIKSLNICYKEAGDKSLSKSGE
jgi:hypothetical protein